MNSEIAYEHIRKIKETVTDSANLMLAPRYLIERLVLFSSFCSFLNFGITPEIFEIKELYIGYKIGFAALVMVVSTLIFYIYFLKKLLEENDKTGRVYSKNQRFVGEIYALVTSIGIIMSSTVLLFGGYATIYFYWISFVGLILYVFGHFTLKQVKYFGLFMAISGLSLILICTIYILSNQIMPEIQKSIYDFGQISAIVICGIGQFCLWLYLKFANV